MRTPCRPLFLASLLTTGVLSDFLGPSYPAPRNLTNDSLISTAWKNVTSTLEGYLNDPSHNLTGYAGLKNLTFSAGLFSIQDPLAAETLQFHHTSAEVANSTFAATKVDGNSIYRVASITKLITILAGMIQLDDADWDRPITDFVPSLAQYAQTQSGKDDPVNTIQWEQVTLAALGAQIAGTPRDVSPFDGGDLFLTYPDPVADLGLPPLNMSDPLAYPPCITSTNGSCTGNEYAKGAQSRPPVFLPWTSPVYTDFGFMLLGLAIANITQKTIHEVYQESILHPLNMTLTASLPPPDNSTLKQYVVPGDYSNGLLNLNLQSGFELTIPSGGFFSTTNDLAKLGTALLNSTLLPSSQTRKWMKQISHTANLQYAVGRPWEIYRYIHPSSGQITDIYTKSGASGAYGGYIILIPDYDTGFSILGTTSQPQGIEFTALLTDIIIETMMPAFLAQAEEEAGRNYAGIYTSSSKDLNTTLVLSLNRTSPDAKAGLVITEFISNGTDVLASGILGDGPLRLLPTISGPSPIAVTHTNSTNSCPEKQEIAFRTSPYRPQNPEGGLFSGLLSIAADWIFTDQGTYGGVGLGLFVFEIGEEGVTEGVRVEGWRVRLEKVACRGWGCMG
ncbi:MAG: hypothetical protein LQ350_004859 [Teloschistes chrysophthalmus]|nr:MAG: hypothetical protein LQ350_004859 [Niorma chrysophthalma]